MSDPQTDSSSRCPAPTLSWRKKLAFSLVATVGFFLIVEMSLTVLGVDRETDTSDPFVGFDNQVPLMTLTVGPSGEEILSTAPNKLVWFNAQSFPKAKPPNTKRVFCLGGSTTFGRPYQDLTSYVGWLRELLPIADASHQWELINAGGVSYASYRVAAVMEELAQYEPDLFIVYTAHNEFLERRTYQGMFEKSSFSLRTSSLLRHTRTWSALQTLTNRIRPADSDTAKETLAGEVDEMLNHSIGPAQYHRDDRWRRMVVRHYQANLDRMVTIARSAGAQILFITPASNEKDCSPFKSEPSQDLDEAARARFNHALELAKTHLDEGQLDAAMERYLEAAAIDDTYADLHYQIGRLLFRMGRKQEARTEFSRAINEDICPLRAVQEISTAIRHVAQQRNAPLLDFESELRAKCLAELQHECFGGEYFLDHVHPTIDVHRQLALWIIQAMGRYQLATPRPLSDDEIDAVDKRVRNQIDLYAQGVALRNLAKVLHWSGKFEEAAPRAAMPWC